MLRKIKITKCLAQLYKICLGKCFKETSTFANLPKQFAIKQAPRSEMKTIAMTQEISWKCWPPSTRIKRKINRLPPFQPQELGKLILSRNKLNMRSSKNILDVEESLKFFPENQFHSL